MAPELKLVAFICLRIKMVENAVKLGEAKFELRSLVSDIPITLSIVSIGTIRCAFLFDRRRAKMILTWN